MSDIIVSLSPDGFWRWKCQHAGVFYRCTLPYETYHGAMADARLHVRRGWLDECGYIERVKKGR